MGKWKTENFAGTLSGVAVSFLAIWYANHLGLLPVGYLWDAPCDAKDILLIGGSVVLIVYKRIFSAQKNKRKEQ